MPAEKLQEYKDIFSYFDRDGGGSIGAEEFDQVMRTFGWEPKDEELKEMVSVIDQDGDGTISTKELGTVMNSLGQKPTPQVFPGGLRSVLLSFHYFLSALMKETI